MRGKAQLISRPIGGIKQGWVHSMFMGSTCGSPQQEGLQYMHLLLGTSTSIYINSLGRPPYALLSTSHLPHTHASLSAPSDRRALALGGGGGQDFGL